MTDEQWDSLIAVQLTAQFRASRQAARQMISQGRGGRIISMVGGGGFTGLPNNANHCASKGGVLGVMRSIAQRFATEGFRVNAVCPGAVATPMLLPAFEIPGFRERIEERTPLGRIADPEEIARPIRFLLSAEASFITGTYLTIDGGMTSVTAI